MYINNEFNDISLGRNISNKNGVLKKEVIDKINIDSNVKYNDLSKKMNENEENIIGEKVENTSKCEIIRKENIVNDNLRSNESCSNEKNISTKNEYNRNNNEEKIDNVVKKKNIKENNNKKINEIRIGNDNKKRY